MTAALPQYESENTYFAFAISCYLRDKVRRIKTVETWWLTSKHERKVQILHPAPNINITMLWRHQHMVERQAWPQEAAQYAHLASTF